VGKKDEKIDLDKLIGGQKPAPQSNGHAAPAHAAAPAKPQPTKEVAKAPAPTATKTDSADGRHRSSPLARKIAADRGIDISQVSGSGPQGRVILRDLDQPKQGKSTYTPSSWSGTTPEDKVVPVTMMRKTIAKRLHAAKNDAPHFYLTVSANVGALIDWRARLNAKAKDDPNTPKVSMNDIVIMAAAKALRHHPSVNSSWQGENIVEHGAVHVAMAVALPSGLVTPVIRNADRMGLRDIAHTSQSLVASAKAGKLQNEDYAGGTFTISNLGMFGIEEFTAIINPPQATILAVGAAMPTPWVDKDQKLVVQQRMKMTLSCDHRVVDGALGAQFLQTLVSYLEDPLQVLA
jgi:pyruvate dehydrogenase E2 component (dihydrolipoamide acetyltransferase)